MKTETLFHFLKLSSINVFKYTFVDTYNIDYKEHEDLEITLLWTESKVHTENYLGGW